MRTLALAVYAALILSTGMSAVAAPADAWPTRPVRIIVPYPAGGGVDVLARALAQSLSARWKQPVTIDNRPGANTLVGTDAVARSTDNQTLLLTTDATFTLNPHLYAKLPYSLEKDFIPIAMLGSFSQYLIANSALKANTIQELTALAKSAPGSLSYASYGPGSQPHLATEMYKYKAGVDILHVPYKGIPQAVMGVVAGEVALTWSGLPSAQAHVAAGKVKFIGYGGKKRSAAFPNVPTFAEAGMPEVDANVWIGVFAPSALGTATAKAVQQDIQAVLDDPAFQAQQIVAKGYDPESLGLDAFAKYIQAELQRRALLVKVSGAKVE